MLKKQSLKGTSKLMVVKQLYPRQVILLAICFLIIFSDNVIASEWKQLLEDKDENITVCFRKTETGYLEFKGVTCIESSLNSFIALFKDVDTIPQWLDRAEKVELLKKVSECEYYVYTVSSTPFPLKNRDGIIHTVTKQDPKTLIITSRVTSVPDYIPETKDYVRINTIESFWKLIPKEDGNVEVTFRGYADPGGNIPAWISRSFGKKALTNYPYKTLKKLRQIIKREKYHKQTFRFIKEKQAKS